MRGSLGFRSQSAISDVDGQRGVLEYRGIRVEELCKGRPTLNTTYCCCLASSPLTAIRAVE